MIFIKRPPRPDIPIYNKKEKAVEDGALKQKLLALLLKDGNPKFSALRNRLEAGGLFTKAEFETLQAIAYYADENHFKDDKKITDKKAPTFSVYKTPALKQILKDLTHGKCAYCELDFLAGSRADIEHFRPKGAINVFENENDSKLIFPGYYWLAADWDNLLWSCQLCNRRNKLTELGEAEEKGIGKKNRFPVHPPTKRVRSHNDPISREKDLALLIHPYFDKPDKHFDYHVDIGEKFGLITEKLLAPDKPDPRAKASIPVFALNRTDLAAKRAEEGLVLQALFRGLIDLLEKIALKIESQQDIEEEKQTLKESKALIKLKLNPKASFLGFKRRICEDIKDWSRFKALQLSMDKFLDQ